MTMKIINRLISIKINNKIRNYEKFFMYNLICNFQLKELLNTFE